MNVRFGATVLLLNVALAAGCARALGPGPGPAAALRTACVIPRVVQEPHLVCRSCDLAYEVEYANTCGQNVAVFQMVRNRYNPSRNDWGQIDILV